MKKRLRNGIFLILILGFIGWVGYMFIELDKEAALSTKTVTNVIKDIEETESTISENVVLELQDYYQNTDIRAVISIEGNDSFNYPVAQTTDNDYYLNHDYNKEYDALGAIYADYRVNLNGDRKILIFGHSSTKRATPFNELEKYESQDYYNNHKYITLETETNSYRYEIFSVYVETSDFTYMNVNFDSKRDWYLHILKLQKKSLYSIDVELNEDDEILIMQTCSNNSKYQNYEDKYLLIVSRRVK